MSLHSRRVHPTYVEGCWHCRISTVALNPVPDAGGVDARERVLRRDLDAYKRLRSDGLQPETYEGAAHLEKTATTALQVEAPKIAPIVEAVQ